MSSGSSPARPRLLCEPLPDLQSAYCASKAAIRGFTDSLRCELWHEQSRIKVMMLQLPAVNTPQFEVVRNKLGKHARPVLPTYQPEVIARAVLYAIQHPSREMWIGWTTIKAIVGQRFIPGILDRYLGEMAWNAQVTNRLPPTDRDNLDAPLPGDRGAHGAFDREARSIGCVGRASKAHRSSQRFSIRPWAATGRLRRRLRLA